MTTRELLKQRLRKFVIDCIDSTKNMDRYMFLVLAHAGSGKTHQLRDVLLELMPRFIYFGPRHNVVEEMFDWAPQEYVIPHLYSKGYFDDRDIPVCLFLQDNPGYAELVKSRKIIASIFCDDCPFLDQCGLIETQEKIKRPFQSWTGVHAHMRRMLDIHFADVGKEKYHLIVVDENPFNTMLNTENFSTEYLMSLRDYLGEPAIGEIITAALHKSIGEEMEPNVKGFDMDTFMYSYKQRLLESLDDTANIPPFGHVTLLADVTNVVANGMSFNNTCFPLRGGKVKLAHYDNTMLSRIGLPVVVLDATGSRELYRSLAPGYVIKNGVQVDWRHFNVVQLVGSGNFYRKTWELCGEGHPNFRMLNLISNLSRSNVIICCSKRIKEIIQEHLPNVTNFKYAHFMALTSDNSFWKDSDMLVIAGRPTLPPDERDAIIHVSGLEEDTIDYINVDSQVIQGVGRLRQSIPAIKKKPQMIGAVEERPRDNLYIFVFPELKENNPFQKMTYYDAGSYTKIRRNRLIEVLQSGYLSPMDFYADKIYNILVTPLSRTALVREFKDIQWVDTAINKLLMEKKIKRVGRRYVRNRRGPFENS